MELPDPLNSVAALKSHYSHLSNVVHASAKEFRMTNDLESSNLWKTSPDGIGKWSATQKNVLRDINYLLLSLFKNNVQGAGNKGLREALSIVFPAANDAVIKSRLGVAVVRK